MKVEFFVCTYRGGAAHRWQRLEGNGSCEGGELMGSRGEPAARQSFYHSPPHFFSGRVASLSQRLSARVCSYRPRSATERMPLSAVFTSSQLEYSVTDGTAQPSCQFGQRSTYLR